MSETSPLPAVGDACPPNAQANNRKNLVTVGVVLLLVALAYLQWRAWQHFDWKTFWSETRGLDWTRVVAAIALIYSSFLIRALRWKVFMRPNREVPAVHLVTPTIVGFTGLALLGRPGELVRPCLIASRTQTSIASQLGVWTVERIFDLGAYALIAAIDIFAARSLPALHQFRIAGAVFVAAVIALSAGAIVMRKWGNVIFGRLEQRFANAPRFIRQLLAKAESFVEGLNTIRDFGSFVVLVLLSCALWLVIALAYLEITHAYPSLRSMPFSYVLLLLGFGMIGGLAQLPAVGGGAQIATILALANVFSVPRELAVSCGILLWLVSFQAVTPIGLLLARRSHVSLRGMSSKTQAPAAG
jgi:glycosyltransferase 2 family protein